MMYCNKCFFRLHPFLSLKNISLCVILFSRLLCDVVTNFQTNQEEVTLIVDPENAKFKNYTEDEPGIFDIHCNFLKLFHQMASFLPEKT